MAISDTINSIKTNLSNAYDKCEEKGATIPTDKNIENLTSTINSISGGGADISEYFNSTISNGDSSIPGWLSSVKKLPTMQPSGTSLAYAFSNFKGSTLDITGMNTSSVINMTQAFYHISAQTLLGYQNINTSGVTNLQNVFANANLRGTLDLGNWNLENLVNSFGMFNSMGFINTIILPVINNNKITTLEKLCYNNSNLDTITANINTSSVTSMNSAFYGCSKLTQVKGIDEWNTSNVSNMGQMFRNCKYLAGTLDLSNFTAKSGCACDQMFYGCNRLTTIDLRNFDFGIISASNMFYGTTALTNLLIGASSVPNYPSNFLSSSGITTTSGYIYVPDNLVNSFKSASGWSTFASRIHGISEYSISA